MKILVINGPNLNTIGTRQPEIYGNQSLDTYFSVLQSKYEQLTLKYFQSNCEGNIIDYIQDEGSRCDGIIINAGAFTHTSIAIADALAALKVPVVEVHISNVFKRETFRHHSFISPLAKGVIVGFGVESYRLAVESFLSRA